MKITLFNGKTIIKNWNTDKNSYSISNDKLDS